MEGGPATRLPQHERPHLQVRSCHRPSISLANRSGTTASQPALALPLLAMAAACARLRCWSSPVTATFHLRQRAGTSRSVRWAAGRCDRQRCLLPTPPPPATTPVTPVRAAVAHASPASQPYGLRDYQEEAIETIVDELAAGVTRQLVSLPTGAGRKRGGPAPASRAHCTASLAAWLPQITHRCSVSNSSLPVGSGKTVIMCHLAKRLAARTLVLVHRTEIVEQTVEKMRAI